MWKVKRMNTARIVVLANAVGAGGIAASLAGKPGDLRWQTNSSFIRRNDGPNATTPAPGSIARANMVGCGIPGATAAEK